jgi:polyhydroxyalkanoate synthesis regulator phasin
MRLMTRIQKLVAGSIAVLAVAGAGGAVAATRLGTPEEQSRAVVNDAARELGVTPARLSTALKNAMKNRVDEAVQAGRLTQEEGNRMKERIDEQDVPMLGPGGHKRHFGMGRGHKFEAAAKYLGMTEAAVRESLQNGKTLAQLAREKNKTVAGLVDALVAESRTRIDQAVKDGHLTRAQADRFLQGVRAKITAMVNGERPRFRHGHGFHRHGGPPPMFEQNRESAAVRPTY